MNELMVYDVSPIVYYGGSHREDYWGYPVGGIRCLLNRLAVAFGSGDHVILCFDSPSFRVNKNLNYKNGRERRPAIFSQIETLYDGLQSCGIRCEKYNGYEADDLVEWAVAQNVDKYIRGVTIHGNDMDLCHSIRNGVCLSTLDSGLNDITPANFETGIYRGEHIPYNTISAYKVFCGDRSDKIPVLKTEKGYSPKQLYDTWCRVMERYGSLGNRSIGPNPEMIELFATKTNLFSEKDIDEIRRRVELIYPAEVPEGVVLEPVQWSDVNKEALTCFMSKYGAKDALKCLGLRGYGLTDKEKDELRERGHALRTGAYAADHNLEFQTESVKSTLIDLDAFTRSFES